jgi:cobalt/nickel transport system permease protein
MEQCALNQTNSFGGLVVGNWCGFISQSGLVQAIEVGMRSLACTSCLLFILFTIPFAELLSILRQCRIPVVLIDLLLLMYRFIFLFLDVLAQLQLAQRARGGYRTRQRWMHSAGLLVSQLVVRSLQHYHHFSLALASRGFNGNFQVYSNSSYRYSKRYAIESLVGCVGLVILDFRV